jgi:hypothetical protein
MERQIRIATGPGREVGPQLVVACPIRLVSVSIFEATIRVPEVILADV